MKKKRYLTLLEMMIVIFLIGLIGSIVGYNLKGSLDKGKEFRTQEAKRQLRDLLLLEVAQGEEIEKVADDPKTYLIRSGLAKNPNELLTDGWGEKFKIKPSKDKTDFLIESEALTRYQKKKKEVVEESDEEESY